MNNKMKFHYVAFLDILGFKAMVEIETQNREGAFLEKLYSCHKKAKHIFEGESDLRIIQFSDSIVISKPFTEEGFEGFIERIKSYQSYLLEEELLCRGGIAVNLHFNDSDFTFSAGLIDAYHVESTSARYPRIVVSNDMIDLLFPNGKVSRSLIREDDGLYFVDYLSSYKENPEKIKETLNSIVKKTISSKSPNIKEKGIWLASYSDSVLGTTICPARFETSISR